MAVEEDRFITGAGAQGHGWWRERRLWVLLVIVACTHFSRLTGPPLHGEETRRATVAVEMLRTGDWIVPSLQGEIFFMSNRPPLQQWFIASIGFLRGEVDAPAVRLPSAIAVLLTVLLIYGYARSFMGRGGAFVAAAAYASMGQVLELGKLGESDALFTLFVSGSMLLWHRGYTRRNSPYVTWSLAYACVALAMMTKGPQAPVYFAGSVGLYLLIKRDWRFGLTAAHAVGVLVFLMIWGSWQLAFYLQTDFASVRHLLLGDVSEYGSGRGFGTVAAHLVRYPFAIILCTLPWSLLLAGYARRSFRSARDAAGPAVLFAAGAVLVCLPTVWWVVGAQARFFMSLYPCIALLAGVIAQRAFDAETDTREARTWHDFAGGMSIAIVCTGIVFLLATFAAREGTQWARLAQPTSFALLLVVAIPILVAGVWVTRQGRSPSRQWVGAACIAMFGGLFSSGAVANIDDRESVDKGAQVLRVKAALPAGATLYSLGNVEHSFAFHYRDAIERCPWPQPNGSIPDEVEFFCFVIDEHPMPPLAFGWEPIGHVDATSDDQRTFPTLVVVARRAAHEVPWADPHGVVRRYLAGIP